MPRAGRHAGTEAIREKFRLENGLDYAADEITVATGAKQVLCNAMMATLNAGDEVIIPTPAWTSYSDIVTIAEGKPVCVPCSAQAGFKLTANQLEAAITPRTVWLILNSPSNPSGAAYCFRISYATFERELKEAILRIAASCARLGSDSDRC
ncbi:aminotransferase class I/II-fold pyridoxal phosphate-dependent enzyme [Mesorhizobium sp. M0227]